MDLDVSAPWIRRTAPPQPSYQESLAPQTTSEEIRSTCSKIANLSTEPVRTVGLTPLIVTFNSLSNEIISIITDYLRPKDLSLLLRTARRFNSVLSAKFYDIALTYTRTSGETVLL